MPGRLIPRGLLILLLIVTLVHAPALSTAAAPSAEVQVLARGVSREATAENSQRKLVVDAQGRLSLAYVRPVGGIDQVFVARSSDRGRSWRDDQVTRSPHPARLPSLAAFPDGSLHLVWTEYAPVGRVFYRVWDGGRWGEAAALSPPGLYAGVPVVAPSHGKAHVLWYGIRPEQPPVPTRHGSTYEILFTRWDGRAWTAPVVISSGIPDSINPSLAADGGGVLHAAWFQFDGRVYQVRYARFDGRWSAPRSLTTGNAEHTNVALDAGAREVYLVWEEHGVTRQVMYRRLDGVAVRLSRPGDVHDPVIAASGGRVVAAWREGDRIILRPLQPAGPPRVLGAGSAPAVVVDRDTAYIAWTDAAGSSTQVRFAAVRLR